MYLLYFFISFLCIYCIFLYPFYISIVFSISYLCIYCISYIYFIGYIIIVIIFYPSLFWNFNSFVFYISIFVKLLFFCILYILFLKNNYSFVYLFTQVNISYIFAIFAGVQFLQQNLKIFTLFHSYIFILNFHVRRMGR